MTEGSRPLSRLPKTNEMVVPFRRRTLRLDIATTGEILYQRWLWPPPEEGPDARVQFFVQRGDAPASGAEILRVEKCSDIGRTNAVIIRPTKKDPYYEYFAGASPDSDSRVERFLTVGDQRFAAGRVRRPKPPEVARFRGSPQLEIRFTMAEYIRTVRVAGGGDYELGGVRAGLKPGSGKRRLMDALKDANLTPVDEATLLTAYEAGARNSDRLRTYLALLEALEGDDDPQFRPYPRTDDEEARLRAWLRTEPQLAERTLAIIQEHNSREAAPPTLGEVDGLDLADRLREALRDDAEPGRRRSEDRKTRSLTKPPSPLVQIRWVLQRAIADLRGLYRDGEGNPIETWSKPVKWSVPGLALHEVDITLTTYRLVS